MITYQDLLKADASGYSRTDFIKRTINAHKSSELYKMAKIADDYDRHKNTTINQYQKILYTVTGETVPDNFSANWKMATRFFHRFIVQQTQFLLGNGITWQNKQTGEKLGKDFDTRVQELSRSALVGGVGFGFWNFDKLEVFSVLEFVPLFDEENGALMAGIRFWQIDSQKPLRATLYEPEGYSDYLWKDEKVEVINERKPYITKYKETEADGAVIYDFENYPTFPIVPLWGNPHHQSEIVGLREQIDCYDLIKSGFANDLDDASMIYWTIQNAGGMDDIDLARFVERMKTVKAAALDTDGTTAEAHTMEVPSEGRERLLDRLSKDLYRDAMALDTDNIASGAVTATQIRAAYEPLNAKTDGFEYCVRDFLDGILKLAGIENENPTFTRSMLVNASEEIQMVIQSATYLDSDYVTKKILTILGDGDEAEKMLAKMDADDYERLSGGTNDEEMVNEG